MPDQIISKRCSKCKRILRLSEFYKDSTKDRLSCQCKSCKQSYRRTKSGRQARCRYQRKYGKTKTGKAIHRRAICKYRLRYPERYKARAIIDDLVRRGRIRPPNNFKCHCGQEANEYHHPDYSRHLYVVPLCQHCHKEIHPKLRDVCEPTVIPRFEGRAPNNATFFAI